MSDRRPPRGEGVSPGAPSSSLGRQAGAGESAASLPDRDPGRGGEKPGGLLGRVLGMLGGGDDPERQKRRLLKEYARRVTRSRPRLLNPRTGQAEPSLGALFHLYYRAVGPARILLRNAKLSAVLRTVAVERCLSERQRALLRALGEESLVSRSKTLASKELVESVRADLGEFVKAFDRKAVERARGAHRAVLQLVDLVSFDYWTTLRKFDSRYPETDFTYNPRFLSVDGEHVIDALKDFVEVLAPIDPELDWKEALAILKDYRGMELISQDGWKELMRSTAELRRSGILLAVVRLVDQDPAYAPATRAPEGKIVESYVEAVRKQTETVLKKVIDTQRQESVEALRRQVFGDAELPKLTNYNAVLSERLTRKGLPGLAHTMALAFTKAYLIELHKTRVKELVDTLAIRGTWKDPGISRSLSDTYGDVLSVLQGILDLDQGLGDNQDLGLKLKGALARADRAKPPTLTQGRQVVEHLDKQAAGLVTRTTQGCAGLGQIFRTLVEDSGQPNPAVLLNWKDLKSTVPKEDTRTSLVDVFRRLQALTQLLRLSMNRPAEALPQAAVAASEPASPPAPPATTRGGAIPSIPD